jgi:predicted AAA+ superfamily ATPase
VYQIIANFAKIQYNQYRRVIMERKIYQKLKAWKTAGSKKPLLLIGARQIGKTYTTLEFCKREFPKYLVFNLLDRDDIVKLFAESSNTQEKIRKLELIAGEKIDFENTVLFFDEVQESEPLISAMKYFAESEVPYKIICAGSLLGVKLRRFGSSFPVGKVEMLDMYPMDFEEFLFAHGEKGLAEEIRNCFETMSYMSAPLHEKCLTRFREYLCIGGMPEAVADIVSKQGDILSFNADILKNIYRSYLNDMHRYIISPLEASRIDAVYHSIPAQLGNQSRKFQYSKIRKGARSRSYESALEWLVASGMVYRCACSSRPEAPLKGYAENEQFKLYLNDPGILCSLLDIRLSEVMLDGDYKYKGILTENYVAGQFVSAGIPLYYWRSENTAEVDFLLDTPDGITPVEVKSGEKKRSASMDVYKKRFTPKKIFRISANNFGKTEDIISIPLYTAHLLHEK